MLYRVSVDGQLDMPRDIWAWDCTGLPCGAWNTSPDYFEGTQYINKEILIKELEGMKKPEYRGISDDDLIDAVQHNVVIDAVIKKVRGE